jgi:hypothetical protein
MWDANHAAINARFGHRHATHRHARDATTAVQQATSQIYAIQADGAPIKQQLDTLQEQARTFHAVVDQTFTRYLDQLDRQQLADVERVIDAIDIWTTWVRGRPVATNALADAVDTLDQHARHAPLLPSLENTDRTQWNELLRPAVEVLLDRGLDVHGPATSSMITASTSESSCEPTTLQSGVVGDVIDWSHTIRPWPSRPTRDPRVADRPVIPCTAYGPRSDGA